MDAQTRQALGGALIGAALLLVGLVVRLSDVDAIAAVGAVAALGGGVVLVVLALAAAARLIRN